MASLAARLRQDGIDARLDLWHLKRGTTVTHFMNSEIRQARRVLVLCSPELRRKVHQTEEGQKVTGVGWEVGQLGSLLFANAESSDKLVVALARGEWKEAAPDTLIGQAYFDLSDPTTFERNYAELKRTLTGTEQEAPPLGLLDTAPPAPVAPLRGDDDAQLQEIDGRLSWRPIESVAAPPAPGSGLIYSTTAHEPAVATVEHPVGSTRVILGLGALLSLLAVVAVLMVPEEDRLSVFAGYALGLLLLAGMYLILSMGSRPDLRLAYAQQARMEAIQPRSFYPGRSP